jgi:hypothetical protein
MRFSKICLALAVVFFLGNSLWGQSNSMIHSGNVTVVVVRYIHDGELTYKFDSNGIRSHYKELVERGGNEDLVRELTPLVKKLGAKEKKATVSAITFGVVGLAVSAVGVVYLISENQRYEREMALYRVEEDKWMNGERAMPDYPEMENLPLGGGLIAGGVLVGSFGVVGSMLICLPREEDMLAYVNKYNSLNPDRPLKVY